jgi:DNA topoisomerase-3
MSRCVIVAEKPSQAKNFARALGGRSGSFEGQGYEIVSLRGHLLELCEPADQVEGPAAERLRPWSVDLLPWDHEPFAWKKRPRGDVDGVLKTLAAAVSGASEVVIATDVDPSGEGELLAWEALTWVGWSGETTRMRFSDEAPATVRSAFVARDRLDGGPTADGDFVKAQARERWDFLSMQLTRAATCVARSHGIRGTIREGRLKSVMVSLVGAQLEAWGSYKKIPFYEARYRDENGNAYAVDPERAARYASEGEVDLSGLAKSAVSVDSRTQRSKAPARLVDLATLSAQLAPKGHASADVLSCYQRMYEDQVVSYPRTEDRLVTPEQFGELVPLTDRIAHVVGVDASLLTHREPRPTHVGDGGAHGANRPGPNVPESLEALDRYGSCARDIYDLLARSWLATMAEDYRFEHESGHVSDHPEFVGTSDVPVSMGWRAVLSDDSDQPEGEQKASSLPLGESASPFVHKGANKRPQRPTLKWLMKKLEGYEVGTGATRTSTFADVTSGSSALMIEKKGVIDLSDLGRVSCELLRDTLIASPEATERLFEDMARVGRFELDEATLLAGARELVSHDLEVMIRNGDSLAELGVASDGEVGTCPVCGASVIDKGERSKSYQCSSNRWAKDDAGSWSLEEGCGFSMQKTQFGHRLTETQARDLLEKGRTSPITLKSKRTNKTYKARLVLSQDGHVGQEFVDGKGSSSKGARGRRPPRRTPR